METTLAAVSQCFAPADLADMRRDRPTAESFERFVGMIEAMAIEVFQKKPEHPTEPGATRRSLRVP
jgi:hypothetical protein